MHDSRLEEPLTHAALDREIEQLLAVDPPAGFAVRARARAYERPSWKGRFSWRRDSLLAGAALGGGGVLIVVFVGTWRQDAGVGLSPRAVNGTPLVQAPVAEPPARSGARTIEIPRRVAPDAGGSRERPWLTDGGTPEGPMFLPVTSEPLALPDVLIAEDEKRAFEALRLARQEPEPAPDAERVDTRIAELPPLPDLTVPALEVAPLTLVALQLEGDRP